MQNLHASSTTFNGANGVKVHHLSFVLVFKFLYINYKVNKL